MKSRIVTSLIIIAVVALAVFGLIKYLEATKPEAEKKESIQAAPAVEFVTVERGEQAIVLTSEGLASARRVTVLAAEIAGRLVAVDNRFEAGARYQEGDLIAQIDPVNYEAAVAQAQSTLADARLALAQEKARADQATRDWKKIGNGREASELVRRIPYLKSAEARVASAQAMLEKAVKDLERTRIVAPFDCVVREAILDEGASVAPGTRLGVIYHPEDIIVRLPFNTEDFLKLPEKPIIQLQALDYTWQANLMWTEGDIDRQTLAAYAMVSVRPNAQNPVRFRLPLPGLFVQARVEGASLPSAVPVPRAALRGQDEVLIVDKEDQLAFRTLTIARRTAEEVYVTEGLSGGERVILTRLNFPVEGMALTPVAQGSLKEKEETEEDNGKVD